MIAQILVKQKLTIEKVQNGIVVNDLVYIVVVDLGGPPFLQSLFRQVHDKQLL